MISKLFFIKLFNFSSMFPKYIIANGQSKRKLQIIDSSQIDQIIPQKHRLNFKKDLKITLTQGQQTKTIITQKLIQAQKIKKNMQIIFTQKILSKNNFLQISTKILSNPYIFSRKQKDINQITIQYHNFVNCDYVLQLVSANLKARQWSNMRGNQADPQFFKNKAQQIAKTYQLSLTCIKGNDLLKQSFRLMHAVGRSSNKQPIFINLAYKGNPSSQQWTAFIGKGVCFDSGGLQIKASGNIKQMHMDKDGAISVLCALQTIAKLKLPINLTVSLGFVQNFINQNSYRPLDIIKSRKGITVQVGNTDAQGRLILADCMNWTQQRYKITNMIQLSTLTGAILISLGKKYAGLFSNSNQLTNKFIQAGKQVGEESWRMPVDQYHHELIKSTHADVTNSSGLVEAGSSQSAAFLQKFVEKGVNWIHLDIAGVHKIKSQSVGYGCKNLIHYVKNCVEQIK